MTTQKRIANTLSRISFDRDDILTEFNKYQNPLEGFVALKKFSLAILAKKLFRNSAGEPLELLPFQINLLWLLWNHKYPMILASRGGGKSFIYGLYALLRAILIPGSQICIVGAGFRQAKLVFSYVEKLYYQSPMIQEALQDGGGPKRAVDQCSLRIGASNIFAIPLGDGEKIRGMRANVVLCDEFASIAEEIFEIVIQPFAAVRSNPAQSVKITSLINKLVKYNAPQEIISLVQDKLGFGNQICISGTATYEFNHFCRKYTMYRRFIFSNGDKDEITRAFTEGNKYMIQQQGKIDPTLLKAFKHTDYAIFQLPWFAIPEGFMDEGIIANARLTYEPSRFGMEYLVRFAKDSDGFFKRSLIEAATPKEQDLRVKVELYGERGALYVMAVDPARHNDNFAIVILKLTGRGYELVNAWSMRGKSYDIGVAKIREFTKRFNIISIIMDQGGGGDAVADMLCLKELLKEDELPIWRIDNDETRFFQGSHILDIFQWSNEWSRDSNHAMRAEIQQKQLLFPDRAQLEDVVVQYAKFFHKRVDKISKDEQDILATELWGDVNDDGIKIKEGVWDNIEEVKNETCAIVVKVTEGGSETFILPPLAVQQRNQSLSDARRRDRYSALLMAAYGCRKLRGHGHKKRDIGGGTDSYFLHKQGIGIGKGIGTNDGGTVWPKF